MDNKPRCFRVVNDSFNGYEVQKRVMIFSFWYIWVQVDYTNSFGSLEEAKEWINKNCPSRRRYAPKKPTEFIVYWVSENCS